MLSPLELLNLYLTNGKSTGPRESKLCQKFNQDLTWDTMLNHGYQSDLAPLLYHILTKTPVLENFNSQPATRNSQQSLNSTQSSACPVKCSATSPGSSSLSPQYFMISPQHLTKLKALYHHNLIRSMIQFNELDKILNTFEKEEIDAIQLKGAELAKTYYPDQALRPMVDIDLLVMKEDMERAKVSLTNIGFEFQDRPFYVKEDSWKKNYFHYPCVKHNAVGSTVVELHIDIVQRPGFVRHDISEFWEYSVPTNGSYKHILRFLNEILN